MHLTPTFFSATTNLLVIWNTSAETFLDSVKSSIFCVPMKSRKQLQNTAILFCDWIWGERVQRLLSTQEGWISHVLSFTSGWYNTHLKSAQKRLPEELSAVAAISQIYTRFQCYVHSNYLLTCHLLTCHVAWPTSTCEHKWLLYSRTWLLVMKDGFIWH